MKFLIPLAILLPITIAGIVPVQYGPQYTAQYAKPATGGFCQFTINDDGISGYNFAFQGTHKTGGTARPEKGDAAGIVPVQYGPQYIAQYAKPANGGFCQFTVNDDGLSGYNFGYQGTHKTGGIVRQERGDAAGNVVGSYSLVDADGRQRTVR